MMRKLKHWVHSSRQFMLSLMAGLLFSTAGIGSAYALSVDDIESMSAQGMPDSVILQVIEATRDLPKFTKDDYAHMRSAGVSPTIIAALAKRAKNVTPQTASVPQIDAGSVKVEVESKPESSNAIQPNPEPSKNDVITTDTAYSLSTQDAILAPVATSNLPIVLHKFFEETYEAYMVQAEVSRRYAELQSVSADERANDAELPKIASYRALIQTEPRAALGACLSLQADVKPAQRSLAAAALQQCIGEALYALKLPAMAAAYLDLALQAPTPVEDYSDTFLKFLDASHQTEYLSANPLPIRAKSTVIDKKAKSAFLYFVAYSFVHGVSPNLDMAEKTLNQIEKGDIHYVRAQILLASLDLRAPDYKFKSAAEALQRALEAVKSLEGEEPRRLENLAWLTLGRIAFENHAYEEADAFYRRVDVSSHQFVEAITENAWGQLFAGHPEKTLGLTHALRAPRFKGMWMPDILLLEASAYLKLCRFDQATKTIESLKSYYIEQSADIARFAANVLQRDYYNQLFIYAKNPAESALPDRLFDRIISDYGFYSLHTSLKTLITERATLKELSGSVNGLELLMNAYDDAISQRQQAMGVLISRIIESARQKLHSLDISASQMMIDIRLALRARESACLKIVAEGGTCKTEAISEEAPSYEKRDVDAFWTFEGEFWRDELLSYQSGMTSLCQ